MFTDKDNGSSEVTVASIFSVGALCAGLTGKPTIDNRPSIFSHIDDVTSFFACTSARESRVSAIANNARRIAIDVDRENRSLKWNCGIEAQEVFQISNNNSS